MKIEANMTHQVQTLLEKAGFSTSILAMDACKQGGNNRTYRLLTTDGLFALKHYFREPNDTRDRLSAEFNFLKYAKEVASRWVPKPFEKDSLNGMALYEFIEGQPINLTDLTEKDVMDAALFFCDLNQESQMAKARHLPRASEACFSIQEHIQLINQRVMALLSVELDVDSAAKKTIQELSARWDSVREKIITKANELEIALDRKIKNRCISPSDFGFHNALRLPDGTIKFIDFEYAGWDDSAKMIGDFFSQLAVPIPEQYRQAFMEIALSAFSNGEFLEKRAYILQPAYKIKWCCIALNIFIPVNLARRQFANPGLNSEELMLKQLTKVDRLLLEEII